jgi:hypothetical protein
MKNSLAIPTTLLIIFSLLIGCRKDKTDLEKLNEKLIGTWHEKPNGLNDTVTFLSNGVIISKANGSFKSYSLLSKDTIQINGTSFMDNHHSSFQLYGDTQLHIDKFGVNMIGSGYVDITLIKN